MSEIETILMTREAPIHPGGPTRAEVHPSEIDAWQAHGWRVAAGNEQGWALAEAQEAAHLDAIAAEVHAAWLADKQAAGLDSVQSFAGGGLLKPYAELSESAKAEARGLVRAVLLAAEGLAGPLPPFDAMERTWPPESSAQSGADAPQAMDEEETSSVAGSNTTTTVAGQPEGTGVSSAAGADTSAPATQDAANAAMPAEEPEQSGDQADTGAGDPAPKGHKQKGKKA